MATNGTRAARKVDAILSAPDIEPTRGPVSDLPEPLVPDPDGMYRCPIDDRAFDAAQGLRMHYVRQHKKTWTTTGPRARRRPKTELTAQTSDELFARVGEATRALFPDGIPAESVILIAEWQRATLRMLSQQ